MNKQETVIVEDTIKSLDALFDAATAEIMATRKGGRVTVVLDRRECAPSDPRGPEARLLVP